MNRDDFEEQMGEVSALSPEDPRRVALEKRLETESDERSRQWSELLEETQVVREQLPQVAVPQDLEERLLRIPTDAQPQSSAASRRVVLLLALTAVLLVGVGVVWIRSGTTRIQTVAQLAVDNHLEHLDDHGVGVSQKGELEKRLSDELGFTVAVPTMSRQLDLVGGRRCKLGPTPVALTLWTYDDDELSLFHFPAAEFGLEAEQPIWVPGKSTSENPVGAWVWTEGRLAMSSPAIRVATSGRLARPRHEASRPRCAFACPLPRTLSRKVTRNVQDLSTRCIGIGRGRRLGSVGGTSGWAGTTGSETRRIRSTIRFGGTNPFAR